MSEFRPGKHAFEDYPEHLAVHVDVAIVGAGAGGSALAAQLSAGGLKVGVFEEGKHWRPSDFRQDTASAFKNLYQQRGLRTMRGNAIMPLPGGRGVGGSTLVNSAICFKTPPTVLDRWRDVDGCEHMTTDRFNGYFDRIWETIGVNVQPVAIQGNNNMIFKLGADKLGLPGEWLSRAAPGCTGCGICQYGCPTGGKASVDRTFLAEALETNLVGVYSACRITGVETKGNQVVAMTGQLLEPDREKPSGTIRITADRFVLSAGPIGSPLFLMNNGLADGAHCGRHLVVHPAVGMMAKFPQEILPWNGVTQGYYVDMWRKGFLLQTYTVTPDQYYLSMGMGLRPDAMELIRNMKHYASAGALVHDEDSEGTVRSTPAGTDIYYHLGDGDKGRLLAGMRLTAEVFFAAGADEVYVGTKAGGLAPDMATVNERLPDSLPASHLFAYASHPMGTCRMGGSPETSVIDPNGRVWGWANLHVADASTFPSSLGVNPQVTTMAVGLLVGERILASA